MLARNLQLEDFKKVYAYAFSECVAAEARANESLARVVEAETAIRKLTEDIVVKMHAEAGTLFRTVFAERADQYLVDFRAELVKVAIDLVTKFGTAMELGSRPSRVVRPVEDGVEVEPKVSIESRELQAALAEATAKVTELSGKLGQLKTLAFAGAGIFVFGLVSGVLLKAFFLA